MQRMNKDRQRAMTRLFAGLGITFLLFFVFSFSEAVSAQGPTDFGIGDVSEDIQLGGGDLEMVVAKIIRTILGFLGLIAVIINLYAGFIIMTSQGEEEKVARGKMILKNGIIGLAIIFFSVAIVQFVIHQLNKGIMGAGDEGAGAGSAETIKGFDGVGALGKIIKTHYPFPNQTDVPRNTKISITFGADIDPSTMIENANGSCWEKEDPAECKIVSGGDTAKYGDCVGVNCDTLKTDAIAILETQEDVLGVPVSPVGATVVVPYGEDKSARVFVMKPLSLLGSEAKDTIYTITVSDVIEKSNGDSIFPSGIPYTWEFTVGTELDLDPPFVADVSPKPGETVERNHAVQITFSEPVDPMNVQSALAKNNLIVNMMKKTQAFVDGAWELASDGKTLSFLTKESCGINSCGEEMFCLPTSCAAADASCTSEFGVLVRTAELAEPGSGSFLAKDLTGITDMVGNALDNGLGGKPDKVPQGKPPLFGDFKTISPQEQAPDNAWWNFIVVNKINRTPAHIVQVSPGIDQQSVAPFTPVDIYFNAEMFAPSLDDIEIQEHPESEAGSGGYYTVPEKQESGGTKAIIKHPSRPFGPKNTDRYYMTVVPGTVKTVYQNCLYPGRGPGVPAKKDAGISAKCQIQYDDNGLPKKISSTCVGVTAEPDADTGCVTANKGVDATQESTGECLSVLKSESVSPL